MRTRCLVSALFLTACGSSHGAVPPPDAGIAGDATLTTTDATLPTDAGDAGDAPADWPDAGGALPAPEWADLTVGPAGSCAPFTPCGGDITGTWDTAGGCFEVDVESYISSCPGAMVTRREGRARGRVVFGADGFARRVADGEIEVDVFYPEICARYYSCASLEASMDAVATTARCTPRPSGDCDCTLRNVVHIDQEDFYETESDEIVSVSSGKRWEYCVTGTQLLYRDTSPLTTGPREPGIVELRRR